MADDIAALIDHLQLKWPDVVGYSLGSGVALFTAIEYPEKVGYLVRASAHVPRDAIPPEMLAQKAQVNAAALDFMRDTPMYQQYQQVAPRPHDFGRRLDKIGESMSKDFDITEDVRGRQVPTSIVCADADTAPPATTSRSASCSTAATATAAGWRRPAKGRTALAVLPGL